MAGRPKTRAKREAAAAAAAQQAEVQPGEVQQDAPTTAEVQPERTTVVAPWQPPLTKGHTVTLTHGAYSERVVGPVADRLIAAVLADPECGYLHAPRWRPALAAWAAAEARVITLSAFVDGLTLEDAAASDRGRTSYLELLRQWEATALTNRSRLGLDPLSRARLGKDVAAQGVDLVQMMTAARAAMESAARAGEVQP